MTHAFFKALLFLTAGSVIHALSGEQDIRKMGGLSSKIPWTHRLFLIGTIAIAGIPPLAGFWSKDEILAGAIKSGGINILWWLIGLVTAFLTAFYMFRLLYLTFYGTSRVDHHVAEHVHEAPPALGIGNCVRRQHLDCNDAVQMRVAGLVHDAHAALAQFFEHGIMRKRSASYHGKSKCILAAGAMSRDGSTGA